MVAAIRTARSLETIPLVLEGRRTVWNTELTAFLRRRLASALGRFATRIRRITVWLEDVNGPRGGTDMLCRIEIQLARGGKFQVTGSGSSEYSAVALAVLRARRVLVRRFTKRRARRQAPPRLRRASYIAQGDNMQMQTNSTLFADRVQAPDRPAVHIGSTVTIRDLETGERDVYVLVRPDDADIVFGRISSLTPAGSALYGRHAGETVEIFAPGGVVRVLIESVEPSDG